MDSVSLAELTGDIKANGLLDPIIIYQKQILDGRHRFKAATRAHARLRFEQFSGDDAAALALVISKNMKRRDLTTEDRLFAAESIQKHEAVLAKERQGRPGQPRSGKNATTYRGRARDKAAKATGVSARYVQWLKRLKIDAPDLYRAVKKKKTTIAKAIKAFNIKERKKREAEEASASQKQTGKTASVMLGDCLEVLKGIPKIDLLIADPPYFTDGDFTAHISACLKKVKPTGQAYVFASGDPKEVAAYLAMHSGNMNLTQILIWNYNNTGQRQPKERYTSNYQIILYYRGPRASNLNRPADGKEQYACQTINAPDARVGDRHHQWQKPSELIRRLIKNSSTDRDFIFDPFVGSGTTAIVAAGLGRNVLGCDIDPKAIAICVDRGCIKESLLNE